MLTVLCVAACSCHPHGIDLDTLQHTDHTHQLQLDDSQLLHGCHGALPVVQEVQVSAWLKPLDTSVVPYHKQQHSKLRLQPLPGSQACYKMHTRLRVQHVAAARLQWFCLAALLVRLPPCIV
jgi:hypothetical protein